MVSKSCGTHYEDNPEAWGEGATRQVSADECSHVAAYWRSQEPTPCDCGFCTVPDSGEFRCYYEQRAREFELAASWVAPRDW